MKNKQAKYATIHENCRAGGCGGSIPKDGDIRIATDGDADWPECFIFDWWERDISTLRVTPELGHLPDDHWDFVYECGNEYPYENHKYLEDAMTLKTFNDLLETSSVTKLTSLYSEVRNLRLVFISYLSIYVEVGYNRRTGHLSNYDEMSKFYDMRDHIKVEEFYLCKSLK